MITLILPGYSLRNKEWAEGLAKSMEMGQKVLVHNWRHWEKSSSSSLSLKYEVEKITGEIGNETVNIVAKSVGTMIAMQVLAKLPGKINKIILCGIPSVSEERLELFKKALADFPVAFVICFQNTSDPLASYKEVKRFIEKVNPKIAVVETPRSDHSYPYPDAFAKFLE